MSVDELYRDRARAESFGTAATLYDQHRPAPPGALLDDLVALRPTRVLDIGCGTGKAAAALAGRGLQVLGVEPDERMAEVARGHDVPVEVATFEAWEPAGRTFELLTFADSWHWIDPTVAVPKAAGLLPAGGTIARFWNDYAVDDHVADAFDAVYRTHAPQIVQVWRPTGRPFLPGDTDPFTATGDFHSLRTATYRWERVMSADEWTAVAATASDHRSLGPRLPALLRDLHAAIEHLGGAVRSHHETRLVLARR